jgi:NADH-ubiquinone oxidoreductase chain 5
VKSLVGFGHRVSYKVFDRGLIEWVGPHGVSSQLQSTTKNLSLFQSGQVYNYAFTIFAAATLFLFVLGAWSYLTLRLDLILGLIILALVLDFRQEKVT